MEHSASFQFGAEMWHILVLKVIGSILALSLWNIWKYLASPLQKYPGPFLARWTNFWRLYRVWRGDSHLYFQKLHEKYGPVIRIGPNILDLDLPDLINTIYNIKGDWKKTEFYHGSSAMNNGKIVYNLFSETNNEKHARRKKPISKYYSMNGVLPLENHMDEIIKLLCQQLEERFIDGPRAGQPCNLGDWLLYFTWDILGQVTYSQPIGYLEKGYDFDRTLFTAEKAIDYFAVVGEVPILDHLFDKNRVYRIGPPSFGVVTGIAIQHLIDRYQGNDKQHHDPNQPDFLDKFIEERKLDPNSIDDTQVISWLMDNMIAGADTTAITLRAAVYYSLKIPGLWKRLRQEVSARPDADTFPPHYKSVSRIPYVEAVIREAMRIHPAVGMIMERYVPQTGLRLPDGDVVPKGVIVGMNPYIISRNKSIWGEDAEIFRPERWLRDEEHESENDYQERLRHMNHADLTFGAGSRSCIGKNLALLEVYKVFATLVTLYDIELIHPEKDWKIINSWFMRQEGLEVRISKRR